MSFWRCDEEDWTGDETFTFGFFMGLPHRIPDQRNAEVQKCGTPLRYETPDHLFIPLFDNKLSNYENARLW